MGVDKATAVVTPISTARGRVAPWQPTIGLETKDVIDRKQLPTDAGEVVIDAAVSILARGVDPRDCQNYQRTGLVVGYVQSGKTLSFTTVMALARDNGYGMIITIAGISKALLNQSTGRLRKDLFIDNIVGYPRWSLFTNPTNTGENWRWINQILEERRDPQVPEIERPTILITVMKHHKHLANLIALLRKLDLEDVSTLIVDDEADQASLNTLVNRNRESTTYSRVLELREAVLKHTFLQYTATPQAPLLINIIDSLSPDFVEVLEPGDSYVGGQSFFGEVNSLVKMIPHNEVSNDDNLLFEPPPSLLDALRIFLVGNAAGLILGRSATNPNRSMLVHPSRETAQQQEYRIWISHIFEEWQRLAELTKGDPDRTDFIQDFRDAHTDLARTVPDLPSFDVITSTLQRALRNTRIEEVNTRAGKGTPIIDWFRSYGWILVGGQAMDRGFTVEGLTVTYMPRRSGVGNADTIQQRGRFFGYKRPYLGYCRTYLEQSVLTAFQDYVAHEEEMRQQLQSVRNAGGPLSDWKRAFVLSPNLRPCRKNVIQYDYARGSYSNTWFIPSVVFNAKSVIDFNREITQDFLEKLNFNANLGNPKRELAQIHDVCFDVPLVDVVNYLLIPYRLTAPRDTKELTGVLLQLSHALEQDKNERCVVYRMSPSHQRYRTVNDNGKISLLFQGAVPVDPPSLRGTVYPGDRYIRKSEEVTIQVHFIDLVQDDTRVAENVPVIAIWIPQRMKLPWVIQDQKIRCG